jgi:hypothetical protein
MTVVDGNTNAFMVDVDVDVDVDRRWRWFTAAVCGRLTDATSRFALSIFLP